MNLVFHIFEDGSEINLLFTLREYPYLPGVGESLSENWTFTTKLDLARFKLVFV